MKIHAVLHGSRINGPGIRSVVWLQGCTLGCPGCFNPTTHDPSLGTEVVPEDLAAQMIRDARPGTEGITVSGGEPMQQAGHLFMFLLAIRKLKPEWSRGMFTGYTERELADGAYSTPARWLRHEEGVPHILKSVAPAALWIYGVKWELDFAIAGRYNQAGAATAKVASANQQILLLSKRYTIEDFPKLGVEVRISADGLTSIKTGYPPAK